MKEVEGVILTDVLKQANDELRQEKAVDIRRKVRYVLEGLATLKNRRAKLESDFNKSVEKIDKKIKNGEEKIIGINANNWNILDSIDLSKPFDSEEKQEQKQTAE